MANKVFASNAEVIGFVGGLIMLLVSITAIQQQVGSLWGFFWFLIGIVILFIDINYCETL